MSSAIRSPLAEHNPPAKRALEEDPALNTVTAGQRVTRSKGLQYPSIASQGKRTLFGSLLALAEADSKDEDETEFTPEEEEEEIPEEYDESVIPEDERPPFEDDVMVSADPSLLADLAAEDEDEGGSPSRRRLAHARLGLPTSPRDLAVQSRGRRLDWRHLEGALGHRHGQHCALVQQAGCDGRLRARSRV